MSLKPLDPQIELNNRTIETATTFETAIEIVPEQVCLDALSLLRDRFNLLFPKPDEVSVVPILRSGERLGLELTEPLRIPINPMRMSYYADDTSRLPEPICLSPPNIEQIITPEGITKPVVFAECVVDTQGTLLKAMAFINKMVNDIARQFRIPPKYPDYYTFAYVSKIRRSQALIPNLKAPLIVNPDIWIGGLGCDFPGDKGRDLNNIMGMISPFAQEIPQSPYYTIKQI